MELIDRIQDRLDYLGWSWPDLARAMGMVEQRVNNWKTRGVPARELRNVEAALNVPRYALDIADIHQPVEAAIAEIRRARLQEWFANRTLPEKEKSYLSQLIGGKASFGEKAARRLEKNYGMPAKHLDKPLDQERALLMDDEAIAIRRKLLRQVIDERFGGKQTRFVEATGINAGELSALMRNKPFGEKKARSLEEQVGLPRGYLDGKLEDHAELLEAWAYLLPDEKEAIMEQIRPMAAHNKAVLEHHKQLGDKPRFRTLPLAHTSGCQDDSQ